MSIVSQFFDFFRHKDVNKVTGAENNTADDNASPFVVGANEAVSADKFDDNSVTSEEYALEDNEEEYVEEIKDVAGITVDDGDDMSPIIMDEREEIVVNVEDIDKMLDDPTHKSTVIEYPINIIPEENVDDDGIEIL